MPAITDLVTLPPDNAILTAGEAATFLAVSFPTLRRLGDEGRIRFISLSKSKRAWRHYRFSDLVQFVSDSLSPVPATTTTPAN